jgi:alpha-ketoglutarate-dependent taurine dioxygenase
MNKKYTTDKFECGIVVSSKSEHLKIQDLYHEVVSLFEENGAILFRNFNIQPEELTEITNRYTQKYSGEALRRPSHYGQKVVHDVDTSGMEMGEGMIGGAAVGFHSESSFTPTWPELIWLYCNVPPSKGGKTTLCDGIELWKNLTTDTKKFFLSNQVRYQLEIPIAEGKPGKGKRPWYLESIGASDIYIDGDSGKLHLTQLRYAVQKARNYKDLCFANHLFVTLESEPQIISRTMADGQEIPKKILEEIQQKADDLTYEHSWEKSDFLMVDNLRFLHGRRAYDKDDPRELYLIQSEQASFGYGSTTRSSLARHRRA